jgi:Fe-S cluster biosynthesis and repair protein YggX
MRPVAAIVLCSRCQDEKMGLDSPPMGGETGQVLLENVCADCWAEWRETSARIINHYGLVLGNPHHRAQLRQAMREFLGLAGEEDD